MPVISSPPSGADRWQRVRDYRPDVLDLTWLLLWLLGLGCILIYARWDAMPWHYVWVALALVMFGLLMRQAHRRQAADMERARVSEENARLLAAQRRFLQDASHQLRTPITIALGHAELLARELTDRQHSRDIDLVVSELTRLKSLAERLLLIATSENPDFLRPEPIPLDEFLAEVLRRWRPTAQRRWQLGRLEAATVCADRERLGLAVDALLENAVQHTGAGDLIRLSVRGGLHSPHARLVVEDAGAGIAPAELAHIFDRFRSGSSASGPRGTGLGLALVRAIAAGHGGEVLVGSTPGAGSKFEIVLPAISSSEAPPAPLPAQVRQL
ncbi:MAG TPA: HAMP domain-containing sensor histidine kinase [Streptosporangiaceae bacterium]|nr:HAMP domain-containing sensor histidine kinase [Streptosporangiaceae bacterium]